jgi:hypothetical protein
MRILKTFFRCFCPSAAILAAPFLCSAAGQTDNAVLQYHFVGAAQLAGNPNAAAAKKAFALPSTIRFEDLVLNRLAADVAESLPHFRKNPQNVALLRPLLDDLLRDESMISMGGSPGKPLNYVLAIHLNSQRSQLWQKNLLPQVMGPVEKLNVDSFSGWQWKKGAEDAFWMVPARDWLLVGRGAGLESVQLSYLQNIQSTGRPAAALGSTFFEADVDWPRLANWAPMSACSLKLGRTQIALSAEMGGFHMTGHVIYPEAIQWQSHPMTLPTTLVREPLLSFATGQNVAPFLKSDETLSQMSTDPLNDQFYFWSMAQLAFQSYVAWPVADSSNMMLTLSVQAPEELNPELKKLDGTQLTWLPKTSEIVWSKLQLIAPVLLPAPASNGQFLVAGLFPLTPGTAPVPKALWEQFQDKTDLVYYDWELTGPRLRHLVTITQVLPILQMLGIGPRTPLAPGASPSKPGAIPPLASAVTSRLAVENQWLLGLTPLFANTVTEVSKTGPNELTVVRQSPFVFSSLELLLLSHWLSDTPAGPLDWGLLPQAKMTMGMPSH